MRNYAEDADLPGWIDDCGRSALSASAATAAAAASADGDLPGWIDGPAGRDLSDPAAPAAAASAGAPLGRARLNLHGRRFGAGRIPGGSARVVHHSLRPHCY
jgi:hypothetical protein